MPSITFKCTLLTPLFMSGANQASWEIRPQSIKGLMSFWWRAVNAHLPLDDIDGKDKNVPPAQKGLRSLEGELFGSTSQKSKFRIRVNSRLSNEEDNFTYRDIEQFGARYLLFSLRKRTGAKATFNQQEDDAFDLKLSSNDEKALKKAVACFWLLANLGGLGSRSRRGGGNIAATALEDKGQLLEEMDLRFSPRANQTLGQYLKENFKKCKGSLMEKVEKEHQGIQDSYSHLEGAQLVVSDKSEAHPMDALNDIGLFYQDFRQDESLTGDVDNLMEKAPMGLPIVTRNKITIKPKNHDRRASPLIFRVLRNEQGAYQWIVLKLGGQILLPGEGVLAQSRGRTLAREPRLNRQIVDEFFNYLQNEKTESIDL